MQTPAPRPAQPSAGPPVDDRRLFVKAAAVLFGGLAALVPLGVGLKVFFDPLRRQRKESSLVRVAPLSAVPDDEVPRLFSIMAERVDAWNRFANQAVGAIYLIRKQGQATPTALSAICPHLGCFIGYDAPQRDFQCPCHTSAFTLAGEVIKGPSPRPLDTLTCEVKDGYVYVRYEQFQTGTPDKIVKT